MIKVNSITLNPDKNTAKVSLMADAKSELNDLNLEDIEELPKGYTLEQGSSCLTVDKEFAFLDSTGTWHW